MLRPGLALLIILLAAPAYAGSRFGSGSHGGLHGGGLHGGFRGGDGFHGGGSSFYVGGGGFHGGDGGFHGDSGFAFHHGGRARGFFGGYGYGYNCGFGFDCGVYDSGYGYAGGYGGAGNAVVSSDGFSGGYVPDPEGADIPPVIFPINCWVRRAAYDPSGAYVGPVLIDLCRPSDRVTVGGLKAQAITPDTGTGAGQPAPRYRTQ